MQPSKAVFGFASVSMCQPAWPLKRPKRRPCLHRCSVFQFAPFQFPDENLAWHPPAQASKAPTPVEHRELQRWLKLAVRAFVKAGEFRTAAQILEQMGLPESATGLYSRLGDRAEAARCAEEAAGRFAAEGNAAQASKFRAEAFHQLHLNKVRLTRSNHFGASGIGEADDVAAAMAAMLGPRLLRGYAAEEPGDSCCAPCRVRQVAGAPALAAGKRPAPACS